MYNCIVTKIESIRKHTNADRLQIAIVMGYQVIVGLDSKVGDVVLLFPDDGQLSVEYATANDLVGYTVDGVRKGGYFSESRKVTVCKLRGERSEAYIAPLESLAFTRHDLAKLKVGDTFNELNGIPICNKFVSAKTLAAAGSNKAKGKNPKEKEFTKNFNAHVKKLFPEHNDTAQFRHFADSIPHGALITVTAKFHGTSGRVSYIQVPVEMPWYKRLINQFMFESTNRMEYTYIHGTRRVNLKNGGGGLTLGTRSSYRDKCLAQFKGKLKKNEIAFFEIVGYTETGASIMPSVDTEKMKDKEFTKRFGKTMTYSYGCVPGECKIFVYRMAVVNPDGHLEEMSWNRVKQRCREMGVNHVHEMDSFINTAAEDEQRGGNIRELVEYLTDMVDIAEEIDPSHIREGICIRVDDKDGNSKIYKNKTFVFKVLEGIVKDSGVVDIEEVESLS